MDLSMKGPTVRLGVIGCGLRGRDHLRRFDAMPDVEIAVVCDDFRPNLEKALAELRDGRKALKSRRRRLPAAE